MDMSNKQHSHIPFLRTATLMISTMLVAACGGSGGPTATSQNSVISQDPVTNDDPVVNAVDITNAIFTSDSADCAVGIVGSADESVKQQKITDR